MSEDDPSGRVRQLLLSGDNTLKNRDDEGRFARARERFERARAVASEAGLDEQALLIIDRRLDSLPARET